MPTNRQVGGARGWDLTGTGGLPAYRVGGV